MENTPFTFNIKQKLFKFKAKAITRPVTDRAPNLSRSKTASSSRSNNCKLAQEKFSPINYTANCRIIKKDIVNTMTDKSFARLEARVDPKAKAMWQQAAELQGITLTDFVITSLQEAAIKVIRSHQSMQLDREDTEAFVAVILNPPQPKEELKTAFAEYKQVFGD